VKPLTVAGLDAAAVVRVRGGGYAAPGVHGSGLAPRLEHRRRAVRRLARRVAPAGLRGRRRSRGPRLEDDDCFEVAGHDTVYRRFGHTVGRVPVLTDQWLWVVDGIGHQLVGTSAAAEYEDYCDVFESVAETFDLTPSAERSA
jgi:hypothetical protein